MDLQEHAVGGMTLEEALGWLAELFEEPRGKLQASTRRDEIAAWDSLGQLVLMSGLDERFGIRLQQTELAKLASVGDILDILRRHGRLVS
ncbi:MAG TPA: acyl carrier protein [Vicinamibacterales bacterium]|nr:acyl carrier protein [Vicinamibacterales bacterium]